MKAGLILPLDKYAKAYGWDKWWRPRPAADSSGPTTARRSARARLWGVAQTGQTVGVFVNKKKLRRRRRRPRRAEDFADFDTALAEAARRSCRRRARSSSSATRSATARSTSSAACQGAYATAQPIRDWIFHVPGSTFETPQNIKALTKLEEWAQERATSASDYNAVGYDQAAAAFAKGKGAVLRRRQLGDAPSSRRASATTPASSTCRPASGQARRRSARRPARGTSRPRRSTRTSPRRG